MDKLELETLLGCGKPQTGKKPGQNEHGHGALAYGGKQVGVAQARPAAPYAPNYAPAQLRLHQASYGSAPLYSYGRAAGEYRAGARMSLLGSAYLPPPAPPAHHPPPADPPPFKKIRLAADHHPQQLRVDTREPVMNSYSTVEVLSPNPPSEPTIEDQNFRTTKDDLLQQISKVDREMALSETTLAKLKKKQEELEQSASKPAAAAEPEEAPPRHRSLAQCIYADNRKRAAAGHAALAHLGPAVTYPLYNQPQDTLVYHENIRRHKTFRRRLSLHLNNLRVEAEKREDALAEVYSRRAADWMRRVERIEQGQKRKVKDARNREFFEKVFPELRKQREERERLLRLGARVKSEAELEEIADGLHEQEHEDKKMRSLTVVPPLLRDPSLPRLPLDVNQRKIDMETEHKELQLRNVWSPVEKDLFRDKFLQHPKNFGQISSFLPRKTVRDCVRFYYLSKKAENYKQLLRKPRPRRHARPRPPPEPELVHASSGVTTRLQRSQGTRVADKDTASMEEAVVADINGIPMPPHAPPSAHPSRSELSRTPPLPPSPPPASSAPPAVSIGLTTPLPSLEQSSTTPSLMGADGEAGQSESVCVSAISLPPGSPTAPEPTPPPADAVLPTGDTTSVITTTSSQVANISLSGGANAGSSQPLTPQPATPTPQPKPPTSQSNPPTPQPAATPTHPPPTPEPGNRH
ncbi:unnamed protein product [Pieris brassicae]|uniref:SANT domain-containing protein n=1 Tax=Pieris brassicae TaxID=7116 RepID=A0A9P0XDA3_PIEBR|nr:unnamed protein product [Pieris brassicae]